MNLPEQLKQVAELRQQVANLKAKRDESYKAWQVDNTLLLAELDLSAIELAEDEKSLKAAVLEGYAIDKNKNPVPGVQVKEFTKMEYQKEEALAWALKHRIALSLNVKEFERYANSTSFDFVTRRVEPQAQISSDLSAYRESPVSDVPF